MVRTCRCSPSFSRPPRAPPPFAGRPLAEHAVAIAANGEAGRSHRRRRRGGLSRSPTAAPGSVPSRRPRGAAPVTRRASLSLVLAHLREDDGFAADVAVLLDPACPFVSPELIEGAVDHLRRCGADTLLSVHAAAGRLWHQDEGGVAAPLATGAGPPVLYRKRRDHRRPRRRLSADRDVAVRPHRPVPDPDGGGTPADRRHRPDDRRSDLERHHPGAGTGAAEGRAARLLRLRRGDDRQPRPRLLRTVARASFAIVRTVWGWSG